MREAELRAQSRLPTINAIWIGRRMGRVHSACLRSFLETDHRVVLHAYDRVEDAPRGVTYSDANRLMPENQLLRYRDGGSFALSANLMRYKILEQGLGLYVDCDVYCLRPLEDADYIFGWQDSSSINCAVLKLPAQSAVLSDLLSIRGGWVPPWLLGESAGELADYPWGTTGPAALTHYATARGITNKALPTQVFYPVHYSNWRSLYDPNLHLTDLVTPQTHYIHVWNELSKAGSNLLPRASPLGRLINKGKLSDLRRKLDKVEAAIRRRLLRALGS